MGYLDSNLAREVNRLTGWSGKVWGRRYQAILVSDEEDALINRFRCVERPLTVSSTPLSRP